MWRTDEPTHYVFHLPVEIEIANGSIIRGVFLSVDRFRSDKNVDYYEWIQWRIIEEIQQDGN